MSILGACRCFLGLAVAAGDAAEAAAGTATGAAVTAAAAADDAGESALELAIIGQLRSTRRCLFEP